MKTTNAENDGKGRDLFIDFMDWANFNDRTSMRYLRTVRRAAHQVRRYTTTGSALRKKCGDLIGWANREIDKVYDYALIGTPPWPTLKEWLSLPAFAFRRFPILTVLYFTHLLAVAFAVARAYGWL
jgi:hypothetical protein